MVSSAGRNFDRDMEDMKCAKCKWYHLEKFYVNREEQGGCNFDSRRHAYPFFHQCIRRGKHE
jgi:hypothetical protein